LSDLDEAKRCLAQAATDLQTEEDNVQTHPYAACFFGQQAAKKATKAIAIVDTGNYQRMHDILGPLKASPTLQHLIQPQDATSGRPSTSGVGGSAGAKPPGIFARRRRRAKKTFSCSSSTLNWPIGR
jgi:hypothetical protein